MRSLVVAVALLSGAGAAEAQRLDSLRMYCSQARALVASRGAVILGSGPHVYDRFVSDSRFCLPGEVARASWAPTADTPYCPVGNLCQTPDLNRRLLSR
ncbi:MAG: hypothetical protein ABWZ80_07825 [Beijerinckiaceae bacterium]